MTDRSKTVVLLIDWDNLQICHNRDAPGTDLDLQAVIALAQSYGTLVSARAYAEWNLLAERMTVYKSGIEPVFAPVMRPEGGREGKSLADTVMVADGVDLLWTVAPDVLVLVTSDKDMIPLARIAKQRGTAVVVLGSDLTAIPLIELSNVFITYRQLIRELDRTTELAAPSGRAPARERRVVESRRPQREPLGRRDGDQVARGAARPPVEALKSPARPTTPPTETPVAADAVPPTPGAEEPAGGEPVTGPIEAGAPGQAEGGARRRRRRGGRRGRGGAAPGENGQEAAIQELDATMGEAVTAPPLTVDEAAVATTADGEVIDVPPPSEPQGTGPADAGEPVVAEPRPVQRRTRTRASRPAAPPTFSEFGPTPSSAPSTAEPAADRVGGAGAEPAAASVGPADQGQPSTAGESRPADEGAALANGSAAESASQSEGGEPPKPVRRRRTRAAR